MTRKNVDSVLKNHPYAEEKESTRGQRNSSKYLIGDSSEGSHGESTQGVLSKMIEFNPDSTKVRGHSIAASNSSARMTSQKESVQDEAIPEIDMDDSNDNPNTNSISSISSTKTLSDRSATPNSNNGKNSDIESYKMPYQINQNKSKDKSSKLQES